MKIEWDFSELVDFAQNLDSSMMEETLKRCAKEIAETLLREVISLTPIGETVQLITGWGGNNFAVQKTDGGFEVLMVNKDPKAIWVNDGHQSYNQYGGAYPVRNRVKVTSPHQWQKGDSTYHVFGHFFVERGILQLTNTTEIETIIMRELQKWWDSL